MLKISIRVSIIASALGAIAGCSESANEPSPALATESQVDLHALDSKFEKILADHKMATAGAAIIQNGEIFWTGYYGEQAPGVPATSETLFNVASIAKTITAETVLRLASNDLLTLDEPMSPHWVDPDLVDDPRHEILTARMALTHRTGFPNWRYTDPEFKLKFLTDPDVSYGYSGEGFEYVAKFAENKLGEPFDHLAAQQVFTPLGLSSMSLGPQDWVMKRIARPVDEEGVRHTPFCTDPSEWRCASNGEWSAADELATSVEDYANFLIAVMNGDGVSEALQAEHFTIQTSTVDDDVLKCALEDKKQCPLSQGYGLGWEIFEFDDAKIISHGGGDWSERAIVYFDVETRNSIVLFFNGPASSSTQALIDGMNALDPDSKLAVLYRGWVDAYKAKELSDAGE